MKYVVIILVVLAVLWLVSRARARAQVRDAQVRDDEPARKTAQPDAIEDMVTCAYCQVHLPKSDALPGQGGYFCDAAHRAAHESKEVPR
jgi:uncharacterized protein